MGAKSSKRIGVALSAAALAFSLVLPGIASADIGVGPLNLNLQRDCGQTGSASYGSDAQGQCSYNIAQPTGGSTSSEVKAIASNDFQPVQIDKQANLNAQIQDGSYNGTLTIGGGVPSGDGVSSYDGSGYGVSPTAQQVVKSGEVNVEGNSVDLHVFNPQIADAGANGNTVGQAMTTGASTNHTSGSNTAILNSGAANNSDGSISTQAKNIDSPVITPGGDGGNAPEVSKFGVEGGNGGSNFNVALGSSEASANGGEGLAGNLSAAISAAVPVDNGDKSSASSDEANSTASASAANGGSATSGTGAQADPSQTAGAGGGAWFQVSGNGAAGAAGGTGTVTSSASNTGTTSAWGQANGGNIDHTSVGNSGYAVSGSNTQVADIKGGTAGNVNTIGVSVSGNQSGTSGNVTNNAAPSVSMPFSINMSSNPNFANQNNTPCLSSSNTANAGGQTATANPGTGVTGGAVSTGAQAANNFGIQDALKADGSFNTHTNTENTSITPSNFLNNNTLTSTETEHSNNGSNNQANNNGDNGTVGGSGH